MSEGTTRLGSVLLVGRVAALAQLRRRTTTALLVLLPLALFAALQTSGASIGAAALGVGLSWSIAVLAAFGVHSNAALDSRLALSGMGPGRILAGRLLSLLVTVVLVAAVLSVVVPLVDGRQSVHVLLVGLLMSGLTALSVGLVIGLVMPGELESVLVVVGLFGIPLGLPLDSTVLKLTPAYGSISYLATLGTSTATSYFVHTGAVFLVGLAVASAWWTHRTRRGTALR